MAETTAKMPNIEVYADAAKLAAGSRTPWTFKVDGAESLKWHPTEHAARRTASRLIAGRSLEAFGNAGTVTTDTQAVDIMAPDPAEDAVKAEMLRAGVPASRARQLIQSMRSSWPKKNRGKVVSAGEVTVETVTMKSGREKPREKRPGFLYELDGKACETKIVASETEAKGLCAVAAFLSRGKLGRFAEAEAVFADTYGKACKVQLMGRKIIAKDQDGGLWAVGLVKGAVPWFKPIVPAPPKGDAK